jgi:hypothetical protein
MTIHNVSWTNAYQSYSCAQVLPDYVHVSYLLDLVALLLVTHIVYLMWELSKRNRVLDNMLLVLMQCTQKQLLQRKYCQRARATCFVKCLTATTLCCFVQLQHAVALVVHY